MYEVESEELSGVSRSRFRNELDFAEFVSNISAGLFLGTSQSLQKGPLAVLLAYCLMATLVYCMMISLGEMSESKPNPLETKLTEILLT